MITCVSERGQKRNDPRLYKPVSWSDVPREDYVLINVLARITPVHVCFQPLPPNPSIKHVLTNDNNI